MLFISIGVDDLRLGLVLVAILVLLFVSLDIILRVILPHLDVDYGLHFVSILELVMI